MRRAVSILCIAVIALSVTLIAVSYVESKDEPPRSNNCERLGPFAKDLMMANGLCGTEEEQLEAQQRQADRRFAQMEEDMRQMEQRQQQRLYEYERQRQMEDAQRERWRNQLNYP